jgi:uncharacterized protein
MRGPLLTTAVNEALHAARRSGAATLKCSLDLDRSRTTVSIAPEGWTWQDRRFPYLKACKDRTIYFWTGESFEPAARFTNSLVKLVPTPWGPPTFEIDGIKMLVSEDVSPYADAERKVSLVRPRGKEILDTCGGLGYFAEWCLRGQAARVCSYETNADVIWLRSLNPWSPAPDERLTLIEGDVCERIGSIASESFDAILHDPPRFAIAGELYSAALYEQLARVLRRKGRLFHYTGAPNRVSSGRDVRNEVATRLQRVGFSMELDADGVLAVKQ